MCSTSGLWPIGCSPGTGRACLASSHNRKSTYCTTTGTTVLAKPATPYRLAIGITSLSDGALSNERIVYPVRNLSAVDCGRLPDRMIGLKIVR